VASPIRRIEGYLVQHSVRKVYYQAIYVALIGNGFLLALKAVATKISGSSALYSDTVNSASDVAYSLLMMVGLWLSLRPPDHSHPHGHERIESLVSLCIGLFMAYAGYEALRNALSAWTTERSLDLNTWILLAPVFTVMVKGGMYARVKRLAARVNSPAIRATAYDNLSDILTSGVVLVGIVGAKLSFAKADPIAGMLVSAWIFYQAARVVLDGIGQLIGRSASIDVEREVIAAIVAVRGVEGIDKAVIEYVGPRLRADLHVYVDGDVTLREAHLISHAVRDAVQALDSVDHAFVHVEPAPKA
jgi:cation diffusion facilitator family transporter